MHLPFHPLESCGFTQLFAVLGVNFSVRIDRFHT